MFPALLAAGANLAGGWLSSQATKDANAANLQWAQTMAKKAIQFRVADAQKAGVHPLFALGASVSAPSAMQVGDTSLGSGLAAAGQNIERAFAANQTQAQRLSGVGEKIQELQLQNMELQNGILASRLRLMNQPGNPPAMPSPGGNVMPGQGDTSQIITVKPGQTETSSPSASHQAAVVVPDVAFSQTATGLAPVPSKSVKEQIEDIAIPETMWGIRNVALPMLGRNQTPPQRDPGPGNVWIFFPPLAEYQAVPVNSWKARLFATPQQRGGANFYQEGR